MVEAGSSRGVGARAWWRRWCAVLTLWLLWGGVPVFVQDSAAREGAAEDSAAAQDAQSKPLSDAARKSFDAALRSIDAQVATTEALQERLGDTDGPLQPVLRVRLVGEWSELLGKAIDFGRQVGKQQAQEGDVAAYRARAVDDMARFGRSAQAAHRGLWQLVGQPETSASAVEEARANYWLFDLIAASDRLIKQLVDAVAVGQSLGVDVTAQQRALREYLSERAVNNSVMLALAINEVKGRKAALAVMPGDAETQAKVAVAEREVARLADSLNAAVRIMSDVGIDTASYRQQVIAATGEISIDIFDPRVLLSLVEGWLRSFVDVALVKGPDLVFKLLIFIAIFLVFRKLAGIVQRLIETALERSQLELSRLLRNMLVSFSRTIILCMGILIGLSQVGISLGPVLAGLGVAGFVIGFALQDSLSNFASGMMILIYRPFDVGDIVEAGGVSGKVRNMSLVNTTILTFDNQTLVVPNNKIWGNVIKNVTSQRTRRVDLVFSVSYSDDIERTEAVLKEVVSAHERVLSIPEPLVRLHQLADSSVDFIVRPWVRTEDYWDVYWDLTRAVKLRFDEEQISIPFPQRDVHMYTDTPLALVTPRPVVGSGGDA